MSSYYYDISVFDDWRHGELKHTLVARHRREITELLGCSQHVAQALSAGRRTRHFEHVLIRRHERDPRTHTPHAQSSAPISA